MTDQDLILQNLQEQLREILDREGLEDVSFECWEKADPYISGIKFSIPIVIEEE